MTSQITHNSPVPSTAYFGWQQPKHQGSALVALCKEDQPVHAAFSAKGEPMNLGMDK